MSRVLSWYSCGDASAVSTLLSLRKYGAEREFVIARMVLTTEHPDNDRFEADCSRWYDRPIVRLRNEEYVDTWDVWTKKRYIAGIKGAPCTTELKKVVRKDFQ